MPSREWWMVQYRLADQPMKFHFCETKAEAERTVKELKAKNYYASCWQL